MADMTLALSRMPRNGRITCSASDTRRWLQRAVSMGARRCLSCFTITWWASITTTDSSGSIASMSRVGAHKSVSQSMNSDSLPCTTSMHFRRPAYSPALSLRRRVVWSHPHHPLVTRTSPRSHAHDVGNKAG